LCNGQYFSSIYTVISQVVFYVSCEVSKNKEQKNLRKGAARGKALVEYMNTHS